MTVPAEPEVAGRLRRALLSLQKTQGLLLAAHRRLKDLPAAEVEHFWAVQGDRIEKHMHAAAVEVLAAFQAFSAAGGGRCRQSSPDHRSPAACRGRWLMT